MIYRRRNDADLPLLAEVAARIRAADGYPIHLPDDDFERFLRRPPPVDSWVALADGVPLGHVALNDSTSRPVMELVEQLQITPASITERTFRAPGRGSTTRGSGR